MGLAHGGQVLVSLAVEELVRDDLPEGVGLKGLGEHAPQGPVEARDGVPAHRPGPARRVPGSRSGDFGAGESAVAADELRGPGRGDQAARRGDPGASSGDAGRSWWGGQDPLVDRSRRGRVADEFPDGVWFVELAPVAEPDAVVHAVASTLSVSPEAGSSLLESIVDSLAGRRVLVVLDNCEHVIDAAAEIAAAVSAGAPKATILATSREPLGVAGEQVWIDVATLDRDRRGGRAVL